MLVEDEQDIANLVTHYLREGHHLRSARDGVEGRRLIERGNPDLAIVDLMLPEFDGLGVCRKLKRHSATATPPCN